MHRAEKACNTTLDDENNRNVIQCCNNTYQGAPYTGKHTSTCASDLSDASHVTCYYYLVAVAHMLYNENHVLHYYSS